MPRRKKQVPAAVGADRLSVLPDALVHHVMSFLEAREAVATCVLARRWRHLWKSMPVLRVTGPAHTMRKFLDHLLLLRGRSSLEACLLDLTISTQSWRDDVPYLNLWLRHVVLCQVRTLSVAVDSNAPIQVNPLPVVSQHLAKLELLGLSLSGKFTDFSSCLTLTELKMTKCYICTEKIHSTFLKSLSIVECLFLEDRTRLATPSLVSLQMTGSEGSTPLFEDMPMLLSGVVMLDDQSADYCANLHPGYCDDDSCKCCYGVDDGSAGCVLLKGLSAARNLKLMAEPGAFILKRGLRCCPTFSKLKTLLLTVWCLADNHRALVCILQHSPVLQKLTFQLSGQHEPANTVPSRAIYNLKEQSLASKSLKRVEVKCDVVNQMVNNVLKTLVNYGIPLQIIGIQQKNMSSDECFSFVCTGFSSTRT